MSCGVRLLLRVSTPWAPGQSPQHRLCVAGHTSGWAQGQAAVLVPPVDGAASALKTVTWASAQVPAPNTPQILAQITSPLVYAGFFFLTSEFVWKYSKTLENSCTFQAGVGRDGQRGAGSLMSSCGITALPTVTLGPWSKSHVGFSQSLDQGQII